jgi:hypothetical protein
VVVDASPVGTIDGASMKAVENDGKVMLKTANADVTRAD